MFYFSNRGLYEIHSSFVIGRFILLRIFLLFVLCGVLRKLMHNFHFSADNTGFLKVSTWNLRFPFPACHEWQEVQWGGADLLPLCIMVQQLDALGNYFKIQYIQTLALENSRIST